MEQNQVVEFIQQNAPMIAQYVLMALGSLVVLGATYIKVTPNQDDDQWLQRMEQKPIVGSLLKMLVRFSPIYRKEEKDEPKAS